MMQFIEIPLQGEMGENKPFVQAMLIDLIPRLQREPDYLAPALVICPGGGYDHLCPREAEPIALQFAAAGYQTFVLNYSLIPVTFPAPFIELGKTIELIRDHSKEWQIDPNRIAICGFSAGGHLCASFSTLWNHEFARYVGLDPEKIQPNAAILGYATVSSALRGNPEWGRRFLGAHVDEPEFKPIFEIQEYVGPQNPPTFLWHTAEDEIVKVQQALTMSMALASKKIPFELHVFPKGCHGLALANDWTNVDKPERTLPEVSQWIRLCLDWLKRLWGV